MLADYFESRAVPLQRFASGAVTPLRFGDSIAEHRATRHAVGLFDFSFMGCFEVSGRDALACLHRVQTRDLAGLRAGRLCYTLLCRDDGSVLVDATVWARGDGRYSLFSGRREDIEHLRACAAGFSVTIDDLSQQYAIIAAQGPRSHELLIRHVGETLADLPHFGFDGFRLFGRRCVIGRLGFSGEAGYEVLVDAGSGVETWQALVECGQSYGVAECGFAAADGLRIESGYILFTNELASRVTPQALRLERILSFGHGDFIGAGALRHRSRFEEPVMTGFVLAQPRGRTFRRDLPRARLTSTAWSPTLERHIALGFVVAESARPGTLVQCEGGELARTARLPFYDPMRWLPREPARKA